MAKIINIFFHAQTARNHMQHVDSVTCILSCKIIFYFKGVFGFIQLLTVVDILLIFSVYLQSKNIMSEEPGPSGQSQSHSQSQTQSQPGSSSSSAPTSSSQGSSSGSGTLSSVDTVPVQELQSIPEDEEEVQPQVWGRIIPLVNGLSVLS